MAKKKTAKQRKRSGCENNGGLGIAPCNGPSSPPVKVRADPSFTCSDTDTLYLCLDCAEALKEHAAHFDYDVIILDD